MQKLDSLDNIFNASTVRISGRNYALRFTVKAEMWLEKQGIMLSTLPKRMLAAPYETAVKLAFAALPADEFRGKMDFETFVNHTPEEDLRAVLERVNTVLTAYYNHVLAVLDEQKQTEPLRPAKSEAELKQNLLDVINFLAVRFQWDYQKIGELTRFEMKELCDAYAKYQKQDRIIHTLDNLNNLRVTAPLGLPSKKAIETASRAAEEHARELIKSLEPEKRQSSEELEAAMNDLDKQFEGI